YRNINSQNPSPCGTSIAAQRTKDDDRITAYPNPYTQEFSILVNGRDEDIVDIAVYTSSGFPVETMRGVKANISYDNLGATWPPGMYILKVHQGSGVTTHLVVKK
ncbi:MAG TPA: T9SS type A sorting domain-containing protein, partial [Chryseosolibacter sp.]|nr:T9SS type A sorting domain-containing protein [Chryseosolibacter sp.]